MRKLMAVILSCALLVTAVMSMPLTASAEGAPITFTAQSVTAKAGDTITVDISVSENHYMVNGQIWVLYDPEMLEIQEVWDDEDNPYFEDINTKIFKSSYMWAFAVPEAGTAKMAFASSSSIGTTAGGVMFTLTFKVLENATTSNISVVIGDDDMCSNDGVTNGGEDYKVGVGTDSVVDVTYVDGVITVEEETPDVVVGDINFDEKVNLTDATLLFYQVNGMKSLEGEELAAADMNGDGNVNLTDATLLFYQVNGQL